MPYRRCIVSLLLVLASLSVKSQTLYGYDFTTGVDNTRWITLTNPDTIRNYMSGYTYYPPMVEVGFPFRFFGTGLHSFCVHTSGRLMCNRATRSGFNSLSYWANVNAPMIDMYGCYTGSNVSTTAVYQTVGEPGSRTFVCEISRKWRYNSTGESRYQLQLDEGTNAVRLVYGSNTDNDNTVVGEIGLTGTAGRYIRINPSTHTASTSGSTVNVSNYDTLSWPGDYRYYQFVPSANQCMNLDTINISRVEESSARVSWVRFPTDSCYIVRYRCAGISEVELSTMDTSVDLMGLQPKTFYNVTVSVVCRNGVVSSTVSTRFSTLVPSCSNVPFTSLWDDFVECRTGSWWLSIVIPSINTEIVDYGYASQLSRHTVHFDTSERDSRTGDSLRTIPIGHCSSVRLGNNRAGSEQESITYTLSVDTNDYDLLILRYAIVEEQPNHELRDQPKVIFSITDSVGNLSDSCYYANFVSGEFSGWHHSGDADYNYIVWRDWAAFGVSLTDFHGQKIKVTISNYDCALGAHFGYVYFTLEGAMKRLVSTACGNNVENTFRAPQGFDYRWYNAATPSVTLSTTDTLHVTSAGNYCCQASYQLPNRSCSFTMSIRAGARYPVARFTSLLIDGCSAVRHFVNQSVVATDAAHNNLTTEPCERYLWRFSDGTVDSSDNVTRTFGRGTHTVTLIAMLANGACVDSTSQTFSVDIPSDTIYVSQCQGESYMFGDREVSVPGRYAYIGDCSEHILFYTQYGSTSTTVDTICVGDTLHFGQYICVDSGHFSQVYTDLHGCDSIVNLQLSCMPTYSSELSDTLPAGERYTVGDTAFVAPGRYRYRMQTIYGCDSLFEISLSCTVHKDTTICSSSLPFTWDGQTFTVAGTRRVTYPSQAVTDSIVTYTLHVREQAVPQWTLDQSCDSGSYFIVEVGGGYRYQWFTDLADNGINVIVADSLYYIYPPDSMLYYLQADYAEGLSCPATDSIYLNPADLLPVYIDFSVTPEYPTTETPTVTLLDQSQNILRREWYVNGLLQRQTAAQIECGVPFSSDSMEVCLVGYRTLCYQSLCKSIPIEQRAIYFPNVFTPDGDINNRFTAIGVGIAEFEMWIYDRRGALMFHTTDMQQGWDGTSKGIKCRQEAYAYTCRYRLKQEQGYQTHTGTVLLLR
ncbi:MAG: gliding motility-associated C-terminal domain-containing protein [Bacteroidales bacterium]|nr:gliding motility-associated C-terminal domain-containing protein [Bacteroidales bacterium]